MSAMVRIGMLAFLAIVALLGAAPVNASPQEPSAVAIRVAVSEIANLTYQLDCLAGLTHGSAEAYRELWREELGWSREDDAALDRWRETRRRYVKTVDIAEAAPDGLAYPDDLFAPGTLDLGRRLRIAGYRAADVAAYRRDVALVTLATDAETLGATLEHFRPRFGAWWQRSARPHLETFSAGLTRLVAEKRLDRLTASVARFYGVASDASLAIEIHLLARPRRAGPTTFGEQVENYALVEVLPGEQPEERVDVVFHELFHYLYGRMAEDRKLALRRAFIASPDPAALATFNVFDEAIATALGNGIVLERVKGDEALARAMSKEGSLYNDPFVERVAKRLHPFVEEKLAKGAALDEPFVATYIAEAGAALGEERRSPLLALKMYSLVFESHELRSLHGAFANAVRPRLAGASVGFGPESRELFLTRPEMSGAIFVTTAGLDGLRGWDAVLGPATLDSARELASRHEAFVFAVRRGPRATVYLFVGRDAESLGRVVDLFGRNHEPFEGLRFARP